MNKWRILGLTAIALLAAWAVLRSCSPDVQQEAGPEPAPPPREAFDASRMLQVSVVARSPSPQPSSASSQAQGEGSRNCTCCAGSPPSQLSGASQPPGSEQSQPDGCDEFVTVQWLEQELRRLLGRGGLHVVPVSPAQTEDAFTLRVELAADKRQAVLLLIAPDEVIERRERVPFEDETQLHQVGAIIARLPRFLAVNTQRDWAGLIGTSEAQAYDTYVSGALQFLGGTGRGFTRPAGVRARMIERLEALTRSQQTFGRAWAMLALAYLSLGGEDAASLAQLAESSAQRALAIDDELPDAHAALGLVHLQHNQWIAAREQFDRALAIDVNSAAALEGLACLLADAGRYEEARPIASRVVFMQPANVGARECLAYADSAMENQESEQPAGDAASPTATRAQALRSILDGDIDVARRQMRSSVGRAAFEQWAAALIRAASDRRHVPDALRAITRAANEGWIDASTEILCGAALRQSEFVFNRMSRLRARSEHAPLRILWMPQTAFLRKHRHFEQVIAAAGLPTFWQEHGIPDVCAQEPAVYGCRLR